MRIMRKLDIPWLIGGVILLIVLFGAIGAEVGGYATQRQVSQALSLAIIPAYCGFILSGLMWLRSRRQHEPIPL